jgi:hypothetical protein
MRRAFPLLLLWLASCAPGKVQTCTTTIGAAQAHQSENNGYQCPVGFVLVGYRPDGIAGPLLCATLTTTCPLPTPTP